MRTQLTEVGTVADGQHIAKEVHIGLFPNDDRHDILSFDGHHIARVDDAFVVDLAAVLFRVPRLPLGLLRFDGGLQVERR